MEQQLEKEKLAIRK